MLLFGALGLAASGLGCDRNARDDGVVIIDDPDGAGPAVGPFEVWDTNDDGYLTVVEFRIGLTNAALYGVWDTDGDGLVDYREFAAGVFAMVDTDDDGVLVTGEYDARLMTWRDPARRFFSDWDVDTDGLIEPDEFGVEPFDGDVSVWDGDGDGYFDPGELAWALFDAWDVDENAILDPSELRYLA